MKPLTNIEQNMLRAQSHGRQVARAESPVVLIDFLCAAIRHLQMVDSKIMSTIEQMGKDWNDGVSIGNTHVRRHHELYGMLIWVRACDGAIRKIAEQRLNELVSEEML